MSGRRRRCPACIADQRAESAGDAFVLGVIFATRVRDRLCTKHFDVLKFRRPAADYDDGVAGG